MEPNSIVLVVLLFGAAALALVALVRYRLLVVRVVAGTVAIALSATAGIAVVNDYYGYYSSWSQLSADLSGSYASYAVAHVARRTDGSVASGRLETVTLPGARSGITRQALVYLPPQYFQRRYAHVRFPVVELLHGTPGGPSSWIVHLEIAAVVDKLLADHLMGPMVLVMPTMSIGTHYQEGVNAPGALDDTYLTADVRSAVETRFRVSTIPAQWGIAGYSSGGYAAANLALRHRTMFGAAGIMDGYFRPADGPAAQALHNDPAAEAANNPLLLAAQLPRSVSPLPSFWLSAGTGDAADINGARAFGHALHGVEQTTLYREPSAGHNFYAWRPAVPRMLTWMWTQLASPQLRVQFPVAGALRQSTFMPAPRSNLALVHTGAERAHHRTARVKHGS
jgi:enterochelin esterase-like enzyme